MLDVQDITVAYSSNAEPTIEGVPEKSVVLSEKAEAGRLR